MENKYYTATILDKLPKECFENNVVHKMLNMIKDNKYYTPSIEEFHVGFEYEYLDNNLKTWKPNVIESYMLITPNIGEACDSEITEIFRELKEGNIRVKYLDREDIESLGFDKTFKNEFGIEYLFYENKDYQYCLYHSEKNVIIFRADKNVSWMFPPSFSEAYRPIFSGIIKNKSELKRVLKQVGVL